MSEGITVKTLLEPEDIKAIAGAVVETLKPLVAGIGKQEAGDKWLNVKRLADYIGMSSQWIHNNKGKLPHVNIGNKPLFRKSDIDAWLLNQRIECKEEAEKPYTCKVSAFKAQKQGR